MEPTRTGERRARAPADGTAIAVGGRLEDLEAEVGEGVEQRGEVLADAIWGDQLLLADKPVDSARRPAIDGGVEVVVGQRLEVSLGYV